MKSNLRHRQFSVMLVLCAALVLTTSGSISGASITDANVLVQQPIVPLPLDRTRIYFADKDESLAPLSFETGATPLDPNATAKNTRLSYVEVKGEHAAINITDSNPRFYLFVPDAPNVHPPFLVRLTTKKRGVRRVVVTTERGQQGFAYESGQIVRPLYTVQAHDSGMYFMEVRGREPLLPGEYAFIGADLARLATFRVEAASFRESRLTRERETSLLRNVSMASLIQLLAGHRP